MKKYNPALLVAALAIAMIPLACTIFVGGPEYPATSIPISTEAVGSLDDQFHASETAAADSGKLTLSVNETQITSLLAQKLSSQSAPLIQDPQVFLRDGEIQVYGKASQANLLANVRIVLKASVDAEGKPVLTVISTDFGPFPAPQGLNDSVSAMIDQAFTGSFGPAATGLRLESISIADGIMTLTGQVK